MRIDRLARSPSTFSPSSSESCTPRRRSDPWAEPGADTGTSTGRLMLAALGGLADVERDLIRTRSRRQEPRPRPRKAHGPTPFTPEQQKKPPDAARRALRCRNWWTATTAAFPPCAAPHVTHDPYLDCRAAKKTSGLPGIDVAPGQSRNDGIDYPARCFISASSASISRRLGKTFRIEPYATFARLCVSRRPPSVMSHK
jgi:hypothetical protein